MTKRRLKITSALLAMTIAISSDAFAQDVDALSGFFNNEFDGMSANRFVSDNDDEWELEDDIDEDYISGQYGNLDGFYGNLDAFWGNLDAFGAPGINGQYGSLDAFWGNLDAFYGNLDAFYGNLDAFWGSLDAFYGSLDAFYGSLDAFWGNLDAFYGNLDAFTGDPENLGDNLNAVLGQAEASFGAAVKGHTGKNFQNTIATPLLEKYGVDPEDFDGVENLSKNQYASLLLELHDRVMSFTGFDHIDHWMGQIRWSPAISQRAGGGQGVVVGLLDTPIMSSSLIGGAVRKTEGFGLSKVDHGAGVASILAGAHDGTGVMGVAPSTDFLVYNPFDASFTASWDDVTNGIQELAFRSSASIINMSLGVNGYTLHPDWRNVFYNFGAGLGTIDTLLVKSAGNSGTSQSVDVDFGISKAFDRLIVVGSVDINNQISDFSNRPGDACLLYWGTCRDGNRLMDRFLVAPGELILVQDNDGNLTRASGTSLAAPQVAGAAALIQSNWEWLRNYPAETADILLQSATDLGAPGTDEIYGRGLLNIEAALAPLDPNALYVETENGRVNINDIGGLTANGFDLLNPTATLTAFESIGWTKRDFEVPVSNLTASLSAGADIQTSNEDYLTQQVTQPAATAPKTSRKKRKKRNKRRRRIIGDATFTNNTHIGGHAVGSTESAWNAEFTATQRDPNVVIAQDAVPFQMGAVLKNNANGMSLLFGEGQGALAFSGNTEFGITTDHDVRTGGVNPFLGLASGGFYSGLSVPLDEQLQFSFGYTQNADRRLFRDPDSGELRNAFDGVGDYQASALNAAFSYALSNAIELTAGYTQLYEQTGLLGLQGSGALNLEGGSTTDAMTVGANAYLQNGIALSLSATGGKTRGTTFDNSILSVDDAGITSTAFQIAASKTGVISNVDAVRLSFAQPMHYETGAIGITTLQITDRATGESGFVTDRLAVNSANRRFISEILYATPILKGQAFVSAFGQVELNNQDFGVPQTAVTGGGRVNINF